MLNFETMLFRLFIATILGAIVGIEREMAGKDAGVRTDILVASGAAIFSMIGLALPFIIADGQLHAKEIISNNAGFFNVIANIVVGVGFLGAGLMIHQGSRVYGVTTAATVWLTAGIGMLCGLGLINFAVASTILVVILLSFLRNFDIQKFFKKKSE